MKNTVLYLSYDGMTDPLGQSQVLPYLTGLSKEGFSFHLISFEKAERFDQNRKHIQEICDKAGIKWYPLMYTKKPPLLSTVYDVQRMKRLSEKLHKKHSFEIVHCRSYIAALIGMRMKKKHGTKFLFDMRGFWADERIDGKIWSLDNPLFKKVYSYFKKKEIQFFTEADYTISLTQNGKNEIESWDVFNNNKPAIQIIPCCVDLTLFDPTKIEEVKKTELRSNLGISENDFILGYVGSIGTWYMLPEMLEYFKVLKKDHPSAKFLFVTTEQPQTILQKANELGVSENDIIITSCKHTDVPMYISLFSASIFFIRATYSKKASSPTKQGEIMAMGIPLICNTGVGDTDLIVEKYQSGVVLAEMNEKSYTANTNILSQFDKDRTMFGAREYFGLEVGTEKYLEVYNKLLE